MAPRGLITILLFYSIPKDLLVPEFNTGILLLVIIASSIMMAFSLVKYRRKEKQGMELKMAESPTEELISETPAEPDKE